MKRLFYIILIMQSILISAQEIRYFNELGFKNNKENADYCMEIYWDSIQDNSVLVKTYTISGQLIKIALVDKDTFKSRIIKEFDEDGNLAYVQTYKNNKLDGELIGYYKSGQIRRKELYRNDSLISGQCYTLSGEDTTYYPRTIMPTFKGGHYSNVRFFIAQEVKYPEKALRKKIEGNVYVRFYIDEQGRICDMKIVHSDNDLLNDEAIRVLKESSKYWQPGYVEGKLAKICLIMPIAFRLK